MAHRSIRFFILIPVLFSILFSLTGLVRAGDEVLSIAQVRALPLGSEVTVSGTVSTPPGAFESSFYDKGFAIQDSSAGIYVSLPVLTGAKPNDKLRVTGVLQDSYGLLILVPATPSDVIVKRRGEPVDADFLATGQVGEATEGTIVRVVGHVSSAVASDLPYGYKFAVDDGSGAIQVFINQQTGIDPNAIQLGDTVSVTGFSSQFDTHYEIDPRSPRDIRIRRR